MQSVQVVKKLNNNFVLCEDEEGVTFIAYGKGIGFPKTPYELTDLSLIDRRFYDVDQRYLALFNELPEKVLHFTVKLVDIARNELDYELNPNVVLTLADHIHFCIQRVRQKIYVQMPLIYEVEQQYATMDDINEGLTEAFGRLRKEVPEIAVPQVYTQIGALDQSIVVGNNTLGISLDKYLGADYPLYLKYYPEAQREQMVRSMIVPDCMVFYILSQFPMPHDLEMSQEECDIHMGKIMWVVNKVTQKKTFKSRYVAMVDRYMKRHKGETVAMLLRNNDYKAIAR